jgi:uncharacterized protein (TIGR03382 family)
MASNLQPNEPMTVEPPRRGIVSRSIPSSAPSRRASFGSGPAWATTSATGLIIGVVFAVALAPRPAGAWAIGSQLDDTGCHEPITAAALRAVRARFDTAPVIAPTRDEAAMIADVVFSPPGDLTGDLAGMALLLAVRDNDLKGIDPLSSLDLVQVHGNPETQDEHCIRGPGDDGATGDADAIAACRRFILQNATDALDGLDAAGRVDDGRRTDLAVHLAIRGRITPALPVFYVKIGAALHALEDGFPHTYRTADGQQITTVLNWIDLVGGHYDEPVDGPGHRAELDRCWDSGDPTIRRNYDLSIQAATDLLAAALDPGLTRDQKIAAFDAVTTRYLGYEPGCSPENQWCDPPEAHVTNSLACSASGGGAASPVIALILAGLIARRRRAAAVRDTASSSGAVTRSPAAAHGAAATDDAADRGGPPARARARRGTQPGAIALGALLAVAAFAGAARADDPAPAAPAQPAPATPSDAPPSAPVLPTTPAGTEPGRDVKTPTVAEAAQVREDKQLGSPWGFTATVGGSVDRAALVGSIGGRYRLREQWLVGLDLGWNPWVTTSPMDVRAGVATLAATVIRRFPMRFDRVNLRSSLHLGASTLLFDVVGAPKWSTGAYGAISILGLDYDLGGAVRIVLDPMEIALPVPLIGQLPLYYEQFRFVVGIQIGA